MAKTRPQSLIPQEQLAPLRKLKAWRTWWSLAVVWGQIAGAFTLVALYPYWYVYLPAVIVVGRNQFALAVLNHEAAHRLLFTSIPLNNWVGEWLCSYPIMAELKKYRPYHLQHHAHTQTEGDPDLVLSRPFPVSRSSMTRKLIRDFTGIAGLRRYYGAVRSTLGKPDQPLLHRLGSMFSKLHGFFITQAVLFGALFALGVPWLYLLMWWVPMLTWYSYIYRIRNIAEHGGTEETDNALQNTRTTLAPWWSLWPVAPMNVNYHIEHHLYPLVPWYNLPRVHQMLIDAGHGPDMNLVPGYTSVLRSVTTA
ncbi:MAG: fatty acid desaturase family protein [Gammaproteobacteria bacterium AqS3]|nr:fatty acid desaturase family protein [Gammaproteobacteria bacterium AqS3]